MRALMAALLAVLLLLASGTAAAWGAPGHRISALVAEGLLTAEARAGLTLLMGRVDLVADALVLDQQKDTLAQRMPGSRRWHYDAQPVCGAEAAPCAGGHCASAQIARHAAVLADARSSDDAKRFAVLVLVHLVGDIHQPLHSADHGDGGGNGLQVRFTLPSGRLQRSSLHGAWDSGFVRAAFAKLRDERAVAQRLLGDIDATTRRRWQQGTAASWLAESHGIARQQAYGRLPGFRCSADDAGASDPDTTVLDLPDDYVRAAIGSVPRQLGQAGVRIAALLNRAFAP